MKSDSHQLSLILILILIVIGIMVFSIYSLGKNFKHEEKEGKVLNIIIFKIILLMILISFAIAFMFSGIGSQTILIIFLTIMKDVNYALNKTFTQLLLSNVKFSIIKVFVINK